MPRSVLEAVKMGFWDFEPLAVESHCYTPCDAMPGTGEKLAVMASRVQRGLPLWHAADRHDLDEPPTKPR